MNVNKAKLDQDLEENWAVTAEAIQTILRREAYPNPYEALKDLTRQPGGISEAGIKSFVNGKNQHCPPTPEYPLPFVGWS
jgi:adenylosuccinate lyase